VEESYINGEVSGRLGEKLIKVMRIIYCWSRRVLKDNANYLLVVELEYLLMYRSGYLYDAGKHEHVDQRMSVILTRSSQYPIRTLNTITSVAAQPIRHVISYDKECAPQAINILPVI